MTFCCRLVDVLLQDTSATELAMMLIMENYVNDSRMIVDGALRKLQHEWGATHPVSTNERYERSLQLVLEQHQIVVHTVSTDL